MHDELGAPGLDQVDLDLDHAVARYVRVEGGVGERLGPETDDHVGADGRASASSRRTDLQHGPADVDGRRPASTRRREEVHGRRPDEGGDEQVARARRTAPGACRPAGAGRRSSTAARSPMVIASTWSWVT